MPKYYLISSAKNRRGIVCEESEKAEILEHYFDGQKSFVSEISEDEYSFRIHGS